MYVIECLSAFASPQTTGFLFDAVYLFPSPTREIHQTFLWGLRVSVETLSFRVTSFCCLPLSLFMRCFPSGCVVWNNTIRGREQVTNVGTFAGAQYGVK